ncbi:hypothetical protein BS78_K333900 [Paspalum vaginatum]|uniref:CCHC-type domain-containing protein n=1 Tax=Paspalum vaginatum TaxID=158149 RepID=A0A9W7XDJ3_9POAL|nr:hypothetical protein BS78_K333900 [Paspalum vaginatum]
MAARGNRGFNPGFRPSFNQGAGGSHGAGAGGYHGAGGRDNAQHRCGGFGRGRDGFGRGRGLQGAAPPGVGRGHATHAGGRGQLGGAPGGTDRDQVFSQHGGGGSELAAAGPGGHAAPFPAAGGQGHNSVAVSGATYRHRTAPGMTTDEISSAENMEVDTGIAQGVNAFDKTKSKPYCFRCLTKGHTAALCKTNILCDECGSEDHVTKSCSPYKNLKFAAIPSGYAVDGLGFYNIPYSGSKGGDNKSTTLAEINIIDGILSAANVETELKRLVPGVWDWKVVDKGTYFLAIFPSNDELKRMVEWGPVLAKCAKATLVIAEKSDEGEYVRFEIPKVSVQFRGLPKDLLENFNILWAVGSALGVSRKVDLKFTREHKIARIKVGCLEPDLIPEFISILIGEHVYDIQFRTEKNIDPENPVPINMDLDPMGDDDNGNSHGEQEHPDEENSDVNSVPKGGLQNSGRGNGADIGSSVASAL